ncbi:TBC1 domain family member 13 [Toxocara canis]|uniref:TBC1 domain family member 13 n=1 Tax=Toxocara canis TaxID=6265 RepID=A0A0B2VPQ3_TOXCA|nr:TBC1 domain family member 13 [Toxocara canis]
MSIRYKERYAQLESVLLLDNVRIDTAKLRDSCKYGIADVFRPLCWRLLLDYLPVKRSEWPSYLQKQRETYSGLVEDVIVQPGQSSASGDGSFTEDHPLSLSPNSEWRSYFKDNEVLLQIDKDVRRLYPEMQFFQRKTQFPHKSAARLNLSKRIRQENLQSEVYDNSYNSTGSFLPTPSKVAEAEYANDMGNEDGEYHWQVVERILFIYSKLNPGVKYVQGMNEIVGPLYYVFANDSDQEWTEFAEPDTYYCFQLLMSEIKDNFIKTLDNSNCGIEWLMAQFHERLRIYDPELHEHLVVRLSIKPPFYAFRWLSLLLSQEFPLPDVITIWDSLFASSDRLDLLQWICLAMIERERNALLAGDFSSSLRLLQNYREADVGQLVIQAYEMRDGESQRTTILCSSEESHLNDNALLRPSAKIAAALSNAVKNLSKR